MKRWAAFVAGTVVLLGLVANVALSAAPPSAPTLEDAVKVGAQEEMALPAGAVQIDCAPGMSTLPPYTQIERSPRMARPIYTLTDGRCFQDLNTKAVPTPYLIELPSEKPDADAP